MEYINRYILCYILYAFYPILINDYNNICELINILKYVELFIEYARYTTIKIRFILMRVKR